LLFTVSGCNKSENEGAAKGPTPGTPTTTEIVENKPPPSTPAQETPQEARNHAVFMGTRAVGQRFCIIADASNSMRGAPLTQLKKEILQTLDELNPSCQFYIIFFNASDIPMPHPSWLDASKENVDKVRPWVQNMNTLLKTLPQSAFVRAFKLEPKPD